MNCAMHSQPTAAASRNVPRGVSISVAVGSHCVSGFANACSTSNLDAGSGVP